LVIVVSLSVAAASLFPVEQLSIVPNPHLFCDEWRYSMSVTGRSQANMTYIAEQKADFESKGYACTVKSDYVETQSGINNNPTITPTVLCCNCTVEQCPILPPPLEDESEDWKSTVVLASSLLVASVSGFTLYTKVRK